jgi:hypothetical protein
VVERTLPIVNPVTDEVNYRLDPKQIEDAIRCETSEAGL